MGDLEQQREQLAARFHDQEQQLYEQHRRTLAPLEAEFARILERRDAAETRLHEQHTRLRERYQADAEEINAVARAERLAQLNTEPE